MNYILVNYASGKWAVAYMSVGHGGFVKVGGENWDTRQQALDFFVSKGYDLKQICNLEQVG